MRAGKKFHYYYVNLAIQMLFAVTFTVLDYCDLDYHDPRNTWISTNKSLQYHNPDNQRLGFLFDYRELFQDIVILIIKDLLYLALVGRF